MSNRTYLCTANELRIYPCSSEPGYDSEKHTVATDVWAVPLLWLMLFRESDICEQQIPKHGGGTTPLSAPIVESEVALSRLPSSLAAFASAFPEQRSLEPHAEMLASAVSSTKRPFVTIELVELEYGISPEQFWPLFRHCLRGFDDPSCWIPDQGRTGILRSIFRRQKRLSWQDSLSGITTLRLGVVFPAADMLHPRGHYSDDDLWNISRLFGEALYRAVPWEPARV